MKAKYSVDRDWEILISYWRGNTNFGGKIFTSSWWGNIYFHLEWKYFILEGKYSTYLGGEINHFILEGKYFVLEGKYSLHLGGEIFTSSWTGNIHFILDGEYPVHIGGKMEGK